MDTFRNFPQAVEANRAAFKDKPVVMFCTGGVRCEKASHYMLEAGFQEVYQLDGGILNYFEKCGGDFYDGDCFVFDDRVTVDPALTPCPLNLCKKCQVPLKTQVGPQLAHRLCDTCVEEHGTPAH